MTVIVLLALMAISGASYAALSLEGQSGIFLNPLAYTNPQGTLELASHYVNLDDLGSVSTYNFSATPRKNLEVGFTRVESNVNGVDDQNLFAVKWQALAETKTVPAAAIWAIQRSLIGDDDSLDIGLSFSKILTLVNRPLVADLGVRSTKAKGVGLFGYDDDREIKFEGSFAYFVTKKFAVGTEFKQQIGAEPWRDIAFRYVVSNGLNVDLGFADLGSDIDNQVALAVTHTW